MIILAQDAALLMILSMIAAVFLDIKFGDPKNAYHPTAWMGGLIARTAPWAAGSPRHARLRGVIVVFFVVLIVVVPVIAIQYMLASFHDGILFYGISAAITAVLLSLTIAIRGMQTRVHDILCHIECHRLDSAREHLAGLVKRDTSGLDEQQVLSGVIETVGENTVDGITAPLFYFGIFGISGAFLYRAVNTLDSMMGYRTGIFSKAGWFAARSDTILGYIPARLTAGILVLAACMHGLDWRASYRISVRDGPLTPSVNSGYPMAALAGALNARLTKAGSYSLGEGERRLDAADVRAAISVMRTATLLFCGLVSTPAVILLSLAGWLIHA